MDKNELSKSYQYLLMAQKGLETTSELFQQQIDTMDNINHLKLMQTIYIHSKRIIALTNNINQIANIINIQLDFRSADYRLVSDLILNENKEDDKLIFITFGEIYKTLCKANKVLITELEKLL